MQLAGTDAGADVYIDDLYAISAKYPEFRASGTAGYGEAAKYVEQTLMSAGLHVRRQPFNFRYTHTRDEYLLAGNGEQLVMKAAIYSPSTPVGGLRSLVSFPPGSTAARTGCDRDLLDRSALAGRIVMLDAADWGVDAQARNAAEAGATAILVVGTDVQTPYFGALFDPETTIPVGGISQSTASRLLSDSAAGRAATMVIDTLTELRTTENIIAETPGGDPAMRIVGGAHLDSVPDGPGMNDNGAAVAALLRTAVECGCRSEAPRNKLTFGFWGAEEFNLAGSRAYVAAQPSGAVHMYLNLEMIASPNFGSFVLDGRSPGAPPGSTEIAKRLEDEIADQGGSAEPWPLDRRADYGPFLDAGIASGGIWGGSFEIKTEQQAAKWGGSAGQPFDACYHKECDLLNNVNHQALRLHSGAFKRTFVQFADEAIETR